MEIFSFFDVQNMLQVFPYALRLHPPPTCVQVLCPKQDKSSLLLSKPRRYSPLQLFFVMLGTSPSFKNLFPRGGGGGVRCVT